VIDAPALRSSTARRASRPGCTLSLVDPGHARELLERERKRIEQAIAGLTGDGSQGAAEESEPGDRGSEDLYQSEFDAGHAEDLAAQLAALERAEARLAAGTFGLSIESGVPIPDERLGALPTAERTLEEQELRGRE
jgi:DnaK suppressor protein